jgi:hypothetical protein
MKELDKLVAAVVQRLNRMGDQPVTAADLANIFEQEMRAIEMDRVAPRQGILRSSVCIALATILALGSANADDHHKNRDNRDYVARRQQVNPDLGLPSDRMNYGRREIDIYRNGLMFEKDSVVGVKPR